MTDEEKFDSLSEFEKRIKTLDSWIKCFFIKRIQEYREMFYSEQRADYYNALEEQKKEID
jgi:hypothetical protein